MKETNTLAAVEEVKKKGVMITQHTIIQYVTGAY